MAASPRLTRQHAARTDPRSGPTDLSFIFVHVVDAAGFMASAANDHIKFTIDGPGEIVATDNGDPSSFERFPAPEHDAFNGQALVVVRTLAGRPGTIRVSAQSGTLQGASVTLQSLATAR
jgi:beta-galactosidase